MRIGVPAALVALVLLAGCGSESKGLDAPQIGKAKTFSLVGLTPTQPARAGKPTTLRFHVEQPSGGVLTKFKTGGGPHTGVHLIMVREDLSQIIHRHPPVGADGQLTQTVTFPSPGPWHVVVDVYPALGDNTLQNFQLVGKIDVQGTYKPKPLAPLALRQTLDGDTFVLHKPKALRALRPQFFDIDVTDAAGRPARFQQYYGALAHAIFFRKGTLAYFHTHICGVGATACAAAVGATRVTGRSSTPGKLRVGMLLPTPGTWKLFLQAKIAGKVVTAPYTFTVK